MKIVLLQDVANLGKGGDFVVVKDGYARNYLIPRNLAVEATPSNIRAAERKKTMGVGKESRAEKEARDLAERLNGLSLILVRKVGKGDRLFGSVTAKDLSERLAEQGCDIDHKKIQLNEPIKNVGVFEVSIKLHHAVLAHLKVEVSKA